MNNGKYVFSQIVEFIPQRFFGRLVENSTDRSKNWEFTHWNHLLVLMFGQLDGCRSARELICILRAHTNKAYHLGIGRVPSLTTLSRANANRDYFIFEKFAYHMVGVAQKKRINCEFLMPGKFYAFDSTTISLSLSLFDWALFKSTKSGIKLHTQLDIATQIPVAFFITEAKTHDVNAMDDIEYEPLACYIFDKGYFDLARLFRINNVDSFFIIREKGHRSYEILEGEDTLNETDNVLRDQTIRFTSKDNLAKYPSLLRRIVYFAPELHRTFTFYTNDFFLSAAAIALLYKYRWQVELFFKWIKQHLRVQRFWGNNETAVRIQIYVAIITYCLVAIIEHDLKIDRSIFEVLSILGSSLLAKDNITDLFCENTDSDLASNDPAQLIIPFH
jgi:hypothetical protein